MPPTVRWWNCSAVLEATTLTLDSNMLSCPLLFDDASGNVKNQQQRSNLEMVVLCRSSSKEAKMRLTTMM
eukprot:6039755-Amphidinium_carterae.1